MLNMSRIEEIKEVVLKLTWNNSESKTDYTYLFAK